jgi:hypothetical protein
MAGSFSTLFQSASETCPRTPYPIRYKPGEIEVAQVPSAHPGGDKASGGVTTYCTVLDANDTIAAMSPDKIVSLFIQERDRLERAIQKRWAASKAAKG